MKLALDPQVTHTMLTMSYHIHGRALDKGVTVYE